MFRSPILFPKFADLPHSTMMNQTAALTALLGLGLSLSPAVANGQQQWPNLWPSTEELEAGDVEFLGIPWESDIAQVRATLEGHGAQQPRVLDVAPGYQLLIMFDHRARFVRAEFLDGRLTKISTGEPVEEDVATVFNRMAGLLPMVLGEPNERENLQHTWQAADGDFFQYKVEEQFLGDDKPVIWAVRGCACASQLEAGWVGGLTADHFGELDPRWKLIDSHSERRISYDHTRVRRLPGDILRFWLRSEVLQIDHDPVRVRTSLLETEIDCTRERMRFFDVITRTSDGESQDPITNPEGGDWTAIPPESVGEAILRNVCTQ